MSPADLLSEHPLNIDRDEAEGLRSKRLSKANTTEL